MPSHVSLTGPHATGDVLPVPCHVAFILDGNRRWARARGLSPGEGHRAGLGKVAEVLRWCEAEGVGIVTLWLLSADNLNRRREELEPLFAHLGQVIGELADTGRWPLRHLGQIGLLAPPLATAVREAVDSTRHIGGMRVNLAVGYDGRADIVTAVRDLLDRAVADAVPPTAFGDLVREENISGHLSTRGQPDPDLIIRTSGEYRLSGFMNWQTTRSELFFTPVLWPDFSRQTLREAIASYQRRQRRFGT
ncbi:polyprenyl diphosphate synthase [Streptomyces sp. MNP-20]|uniref:polyprenyl diphosphate synthase n=1 Tax=Streptomyces sp. MNP-20 TaxID=2721165 RepID=UPI001553D039|nr:polyprenyl diphosphate synthase [Streptomyces sp. MNP-20]